MEPIFLLSLPRSGSTLVQRVLASHQEITTTSEPWILLPLVYSLRKNGTLSEYDPQRFFPQAIEDFCSQLPNNKKDYLDAIRDLSLDLYSKTSSENTKYFLDKTPRYHLIVDELLAIFPSAKFIILWRNPLSIAASTMDTWSNGRWNLHRHHIDFHTGLKNLIRIAKDNKDRVHILNFENFVTNPKKHYQELTEYLDLTADDSAITTFTNTNLKGRLGDPTGVVEYSSISDKSIDKWKKTMSNPWRRYWCIRYLNYIGKEDLKFMGYDINEIKRSLTSQPLSTNKILSDIPRIIYGWLYTKTLKLLLK